jgi:hypothetical protein
MAKDRTLGNAYLFKRMLVEEKALQSCRKTTVLLFKEKEINMRCHMPEITLLKSVHYKLVFMTTDYTTNPS